jgi:hypothetical protein
MKDQKMSWKTVLAYALLASSVLIGGVAFGQNPCDSDICVVQFNASWNESNNVGYLDELTNCDVLNVNIDEGAYQKEYGIVVVPTIIVFNGKEVERFQANIMMEMEATRKEVQGVIDELLMNRF